MADTPVAPLSAVDTDTTPGIESQYKTTPGRAGQITTLTPTSGVAINAQNSAAIRAKLEQMISEKESPFEKFKQNIDTAIAHTGYMPTQRILENRKMLEQQDTSLYNMKLQAESLRAQEQANKEFAQRMFPQQGQTSAVTYQTPGGVAPGQAAGAIPGSFEDLTKDLSGPEKAVAMEYLRNGMQKELFTLIAQSAQKRPDLQKNLQFAATLPENQQRIFLGQAFEKGMGPQSYIGAGGKEFRFSPEGAMPGASLFAKPQIPAATTGANIPDAEAWARANGIPISPNGGNRTFNQQVDQFIQNPNLAAIPGTSPHEQKRAIDVKEKDRTPEIKAKILAAGFKNTRPDEPWHFELPKQPGAISAPPPASLTAGAPGTPGTSVEDIRQQEKGLEASTASFHANDYKAITERANTAREVERLADQALDNIKGNNYGPGTELGQSFAKYAQMAGVKLNPEETDKYISNMNIETARKFLSAQSARQAMGAQFTSQEAADWLRAFAGIDSPKEYLKNFYQVQRAGALVDQDVKNYLLRNKGREQEAYIEWQNSGAKDRIMRENVDAFKKGKVPEGAQPAKANKPKTVQKTGMVTDKANPNYGKQAILYTDGTLEYK